MCVPVGGETAGIPRRKLITAKFVLGSVIAVTSVLPLLFVDFAEPSTELIVYKALAKAGAFVGGMFLIWQFFLGFRGAVSSLFPDLSWVVDVHKALGQYGVLVIPLHPIFIGLYYLRLHDINIYRLDLETAFSQWVLLGMILLGLIAFIVVSSAFFRQKMGFYRWLYTHLSSYLVPPLLFTHSFLLGPTIQGTPLRFVWWGLTALMVLLYLYRIVHKLRLFAGRYRVREATEVANKTTQILLQPLARALKPALGQFVYVRQSVAENAHPYTVSAYDAATGVLGITAKEQGPQTARLQQVEKGAGFIVDGPYGVFTRVALASDLPIVMIAGGIGITPFRRLWQLLERERSREAHLVYGNEVYDDMVYRDELDALEHVHVVHVLNEEPDFPGEKGFVTVDLLQRNLPRELTQYLYLLCGPPKMVRTLEASLKEAGVPQSQVQHELFDM